MYVSPALDEGELFLGTHLEADFKFGDPEQSIGLIRITDDEQRDVVLGFLKHFKIIPNGKVPLIVSLKHLFSNAQKVKWDLDQIQTLIHDTGSYTLRIGKDEPEVVYAVPMESYFTYIRLMEILTPLRQGLSGERVDIPVTQETMGIDYDTIGTQSVFKTTVKAKNLKGTPLELPKGSAGRPLILTRGRDLPTPKKLLEKQADDFQYTYALRLWTIGPKEVCFAGYFKMPGYEAILGRVNLFLNVRKDAP